MIPNLNPFIQYPNSFYTSKQLPEQFHKNDVKTLLKITKNLTHFFCWFFFGKSEFCLIFANLHLKNRIKTIFENTERSINVELAGLSNGAMKKRCHRGIFWLPSQAHNPGTCGWNGFWWDLHMNKQGSAWVWRYVFVPNIGTTHMNVNQKWIYRISTWTEHAVCEH